MTKKDFELIASIIKEINIRKAKGDRIAILFANELKSKYPRFDSDRFIKACGIK